MEGTHLTVAHAGHLSWHFQRSDCTNALLFRVPLARGANVVIDKKAGEVLPRIMALAFS